MGISLDGRHLHLDRIPGRQRQKRTSKSIRINISYLFKAVNRRLLMREVIFSVKEVNVESGDETEQEFRSEEVIGEEVIGEEVIGEEVVGKEG